MINNDRKIRLRKAVGKKLIGIAIILIGVAVLIYTTVRPNIIRVCSYTAQALMTDLVSTTINNELDTAKEQIEYSDLVEVTYAENGSVTSVKSNTPLINRLKTDLTTEINRILRESKTETVDLSLGTLTGLPFLQGSGPAVEMRFEPKGYADAMFISEFTDAGINQTRHRIVMKTTINAVSFIPFFAVETAVSTDFLIAETIIVGEIPESYTHVIGASDDTIDKINDYGSNTP